MYLSILVNRQTCTIQYVSASIETWTEQAKVLEIDTILPIVLRTPLNALGPRSIPPRPGFTGLSKCYLDFATGSHACVFGFTLRAQSVSTHDPTS